MTLRPLRRTLGTTVAAALLTGAAMSTAQAAPVAADPTAGTGSIVAAGTTVTDADQAPLLTLEQYRELYDAFVADGGQVAKTGEVTLGVPGFGPMTLAHPAQTTGTSSPALGGGWDGLSGPYVSLNRTDQGALLAGGTAALAAAICLIPAVGQAACVAAAALVAAAAYYLNENGRCPTSKPNLRIYVWNRSKIGCYS